MEDGFMAYQIFLILSAVLVLINLFWHHQSKISSGIVRRISRRPDLLFWYWLAPLFPFIFLIQSPYVILFAAVTGGLGLSFGYEQLRHSLRFHAASNLLISFSLMQTLVSGGIVLLALFHMSRI
jgi:hypothetical protein